MGPLELQQMAIAKGIKPNQQVIVSEGQSYTRTETTDGVYSVITIVNGNKLVAYAYMKWRRPSLKLGDLKPGKSEALDIRDLHVDTKYRGQGFGTMLLDRIITWARAESVAKIWGGIVQKDIDASPFLLDWYQRHGFTVDDPEDRNFLAVKNEYSVWLDVTNSQPSES